MLLTVINNYLTMPFNVVVLWKILFGQNTISNNKRNISNKISNNKLFGKKQAINNQIKDNRE